ncbi:MAG: PAS domain S-box protein [Balneolales bacterium]
MNHNESMTPDQQNGFGFDHFALLKLDSNGFILSANKGAEHLTQYDIEELKTRHYSVLLADQHGAHQLDLAAGQGHLEEYGSFVRKDHHPFRARSIYTRITGENDAVDAFTLVIKDKMPDPSSLAENILHESVDAVVITDARLNKPGPKILYVNPQFTKMTGYSAPEVLGQTPRILQGAKTDRKVLTQLKNNLIKGKPFKGQTINYRKDGSEFFLEWNISPIRGLNGDVSHYISIQRDITERMRLKNELLAREEQLRLMAETTDDIVSLHRNDGAIINCNPSMERILGYKPRELIGKSPFNFFHPKDQAKGLAEFAMLSVNGKTSTYNYRMKHKNGTYIWLESRVQPAVDKEGNINCIVAFSRNLTHQKAARNELKLQKAYFEQLFESSPEGVVILDKADRIVNANRSFLDLFQHKMEDIKGENINHLIIPDPDSVDELKTSYKALGSNSHQIEAVRKRKDGTLVNVSIIGASIEYEKEIVGVYGIYRDITLQKKDENTVKQSLREKEVLLQEIHHRVKNNMQVISSLHNLQARQIKDERTLAIFKESQNRVQAMALIHDQLYKSDDLAQINFGDYLKDLVHQLFSSIGRFGISYSVKSDPVSFNVNQAVPCGLIVNELVTNSLKHGFDGGRTGKIEISLKDIDHEHLLLEVADNGAGFPPDVDFKNTSSSLGLQLVNGLVGQIKGKITLSTGNETRFSIKLPKFSLD